ncbi:MAG: hypothetical protein Q8O26_12335 [Phreatobacter sp.]|uniref:hypothetical protein n=1 Tax=Phreatobacter sp. TaxID=1966341 RepID=UPI0027323540|nr:hypothetical protein [Phreatobacter sp.]MDP2802660.1 hypothetical protein [Phreatobacter sp.]
MTIETAMVFVLGFVVAALLSLALMGAVWRRAVRLTTRRVESAVPLSMAEIKADKDQVRAESALAIRRAEIVADKLREAANLQTIEIARRVETIRDLNVELDARAARIAGLEGDRTRLEAQVAATEATVAARAEDLAGARIEIAAGAAALAALTSEHEAKVAESDAQRVAIVALRTQVDNQRSQIGKLSADLATAEADLAGHRLSYAETSNLLTSERQRIADVQAALKREQEGTAGLRADLADTGRKLAETATLLTAERKRSGEQAGEIKGLQGRLAAEEKRAAKLERERDKLQLSLASETERATREQSARDAVERSLARIEADRDRVRKEVEEVKERSSEAARRLQIAAETAIAEKNVLEGSLANVREDRTRIQREVAALTRSAENVLVRETVDGDELRSRIDDVAIEVARVTSLLEGPGSRIDQILAASAPTGAGGRRRRNDLPLAERIRAVLDASRGNQAAE